MFFDSLQEEIRRLVPAVFVSPRGYLAFLLK